jgi:two-component system OmpR family response regulator
LSKSALQAYVVEDNPMIRENLVAALEELTRVIVVGTSGTEDEAAQWFERNPGSWQLAIVDLFLKQGSGLHLVERIGPRQPQQKVVVFSNYVNPQLRKRCAQIGVDAVFDKSTEIDALVDYVARHCFVAAEAGAPPA